MNNELYRKLTSITLMTIMFAGGMTIAIPGETPVAIAQTGMLSVSATAAPDNSFGGPQVIQIVVDDPSRSDISGEISSPDVTVDGTSVTMTQADTGKWYAYVASEDISLAPTPLIGAIDANTDIATAEANFLDDSPESSADATNDPIKTIRIFDFDGDVEIALGSESITLNYDQDLDSLATVSVDRTGVPIDGQVHVTVSDFRLNLDPTAADVWFMTVNGNYAQYDLTADGLAAATVSAAAIAAAEANPPTNGWQVVFDGDDNDAGEFAISDTAIAQISALEGDATETPNLVRFEETGANTGVFTNEDGDDKSNIVATGDENDDFTVDYADDSVQVFIEDFDSTLETIADGTWNSGDTITVRLTNENLNTNTLTDQDMELGDPNLPVLMMGDEEPITLSNVKGIDPVGGELGDSLSVNANTHVATLTTTSNEAAVFTVTLTEAQNDRLKDNTLNHYINYHSDVVATTNAHLNGTTPDITATPHPVNNGEKIVVDSDADGIFNITFAPPTLPSGSPLTAANTNNNDIQNAVAAAETAADAEDATAETVRDAVSSVSGVDGFDAAIDDIDIAGADTDSVLAEIRTVAQRYLVTVEYAIAADIFTFGDGVNYAIYRALLAETDSGSGVFEGTVEYQMLNQRTVNAPDTYDDLVAVSDELVMILDKDYTGTDAPEVTYAEDNASEDAPTNTGEVSVDAATYRVADDVTITLTDLDLNTDSEAREIYHIVDSDGNTEMPALASVEIGSLNCEAEITSVSLRETADDSGVFEGSFEIPNACDGDLTTGESITVTYTDFRDETGGDSEWSDSATIGAVTGSVSLDRTVYPVPRAADAVDGLEATQVTIHVSVDDADENTSSSSRNTITGVTMKIADEDVTLPTKLEETEPDSGIFEAYVEIGASIGDHSIEQGDIITVKYVDASDASGNENTASDSATFDLRNAVLQSDKKIYVIGQDALLTLIEPDLNLNSRAIDSVDLDRIAWDSAAYDEDEGISHSDFGAVPQSLRENGANSGIFHVVITIPETIAGDTLNRGEEITLTYTDYGPSGADFVGDDDRDVDLFIETSDFGATIELDQNVYTWTDKVFISIVASDYNFDSNIVDEIGTEDNGEITVRTREGELEQYRLAETGPDTGVFTGEVTLTGNQNSDFDAGHLGNTEPEKLGGPTNGELATKDDGSDGLSVTFDFSDGQAPIVASALIRWNVGEVQWLEASHAATSSGIVRVIDPDLNLRPDAVDSTEVVVYSETFIGGIDLTVTETREASGIFEGTVEFDPESASDGHRLQVTEGDIVTASYDDVTLPDGDDLTISATTLIGSIVPPLERAPASNPAIVDAFGNSLASVSVDQQVLITADITSGQDRDQDFAYLVQIQNEDEVTIALSWIAGTIGAGATFSQSQSWTPDATGSYTATIFVWESVSNPTALSPQLSITIDVV